MGTFHSIDELIKTLDREKVLLKEMFAKRHSLQFRYDYALEMTEYKEDRIRYLIENGVIRDTGDCLEILIFASFIIFLEIIVDILIQH